ncbi:MAG: Hsp70 family protein [Holosporales bacterium]|nr:Hsp70 family protein [Holosporales bacterium]
MVNVVAIGNVPAPSQRNGVVVGIDLGTTNSVVSLSKNQVASVLQFPQAPGGLVKSQVRIKGSVVKSFKRGMETPEEIFAMEQTPLALSTEVLMALKKETERFLGEDIGGAVITVPARFSNIARKATKQAAQHAGINVIRLINEPTAAAIAYGLNTPDSNGVFVVYDFGGGTFDATILRIENGVFQVLGSSGDLLLGGDDIDKDISTFLPFDNTISRSKAQEIKESFCDKNFVSEFISRADFDAIAKKHVDKTICIVKNLLRDIRVEPSDVDGVILVGGSTRLHYVTSAISAVFGDGKIRDTINPDCAVSIGAALHGEALTNSAIATRPLLLDIVPFSLGIETVMGCVETVIPKYTPTPVSTTVNLSTFYNNQTDILIHVVQGDNIAVEKCTSLGKLILTGISPMPSGTPRIEIMFNVDDNGLLSVVAHEEICDVKREIQIDFCSNLFQGPISLQSSKMGHLAGQ